jgi:hypothetical protein
MDFGKADFLQKSLKSENVKKCQEISLRLCGIGLVAATRGTDYEMRQFHSRIVWCYVTWRSVNELPRISDSGNEYAE